MKKITLSIVSIFLFVPVFAYHITVNNDCKKAYTDIVSLRFEHAKILLENEKKRDPENIYPVYLENYIEFLQTFIGESDNDYQILKANKEQRISLLEKLPENNPYRNYLIGNIRLQYAMAATKFGDYFYSALDVRRSFLLIKENVANFPDFQPQYATLGVLHILIGMIPDKFHWILSLISMEGTVNQGLNELKTVLKNTENNPQLSFMKPEVLFYIAFTEMNLGIDEQTKQKLSAELEKYAKENLLLRFLRVNMLMRLGNNDEALNLLQDIDNLNDYYPFYYLYYLRGQTLLRKLQPKARNSLKFFMDNFKGKNYLKDAQRKIAWSYLLENDVENYKTNIKTVLSVGDDFVGVDKEADKEAESGKVPNVSLLKSRLLFDGGYYQQSKKILLSLKIIGLNNDEKLERIYRLGRIAQKTGNLPEAINYFVKTVEQGKNSKRYFAGNAALQLGKIFEQKEKYSQALKYYKICRNLDFDEYETGIKEKAKQGIKRVEEKLNK